MANNRIAENFIDGIIFPQSRKKDQDEVTAREEKINDLYEELTFRIKREGGKLQ